jgi:hypothetical protein
MSSAILANAETLIPLAEVTSRLTWLPRRGGKAPTLQTLYAWCNRGLDGTRLEWVQAGNGRCTSEAALRRFFNRLTAPEAMGADADADDRQQQEAHARARMSLQAQGILRKGA